MQNTRLSITPYPKEVQFLSEGSRIYPAQISAPDKYQKQTDAFVQLMRKTASMDFSAGGKGIEIIEDLTLNPWQYRIECAETVRICVCDLEGLAAALAAFYQLFRKAPDVGCFEFPSVKIDDYPMLSYRGLMVDVARQYHPFSDLLELVDLCFLFKINYLQLHFTDTNAFTLPVSIIRNRAPGDFYYTKEQIGELCEYAKAKGVTIVPEVEMPGHSNYLTSILKEMTSSGSSHEYTLCASWLESSSVIYDLVSEVCGMFPDAPFIHLGADEVATGEWKNCPECQDYCRKKGFASVKE